MGVAVLAGVGCGIFADFSVTERFIKITTTIKPIPENVAKYKKIMPIFDKSYYSLCDIYTEIANLDL